VNLPKISEPLTATELRVRVLAQMNGQSRKLSPADRERRAKVLASLRKGETR
jgi:type IV pilus biogenesis protein CpaD/CtpE